MNYDTRFALIDTNGDERFAARIKKERGRLPDINAQDAWEKRLADPDTSPPW